MAILRIVTFDVAGTKSVPRIGIPTAVRAELVFSPDSGKTCLKIFACVCNVHFVRVSTT